MIRQLVAFTLALALLHLNVGRVDASCAMHDHDGASTSHAGMQHDAGAPAEETACETPASPECCLALASCAPTLDADEGSSVTAAIVHMTIAAAVIKRPLSRSTAPEPPPPKA